jgi:hypothetical protein
MTTADIYTDWDIDQLEGTWREISAEEERWIVPASLARFGSTKRGMRLAGIEPATSRSGGARSIP